MVCWVAARSATAGAELRMWFTQRDMAKRGTRAARVLLITWLFVSVFAQELILVVENLHTPRKESIRLKNNRKHKSKKQGK